MSNIVHMHASGLPLREPEQLCEACGTIGTVGRAMRTDQLGDATEIHRFCAACWPEHSARYRARWGEENRLTRDAWSRDPSHAVAPSGGTAFETATWHGVIEYVQHINEALHPSQPPTAAQLAEIAEELEKSAADFVGEMPIEVVAFIQRHGSPAS
jgi:hypothetical protein